MKRLKNVLMAPNISCGYLYFYIHLITEICSFYYLSSAIGNNAYLWVLPLIYDTLAFTPQSIFGYLSDRYPKIPLGLIGAILIVIALFISSINLGKYTAVIILCLGNALIHVNGAEVTLRSSKGKLSHSAIFVSGGSFGVIAGKILGDLNVSRYIIIVLALTMITFILLAETYRPKNKELKEYHYHNPKISKGLLIILAVIIVVIRGYMGYGIPTSWNKTIIESIFLYSFMGLGKALGGILSDLIGMKKVAYLSIIGALPFLLIGNNLMIISLIGVMLFSMTMSVTLGLLVSVLKESPGLAFGLTTIGLFLGTIPIFFIQISSYVTNSIIITISTLLCLVILKYIIRGEKDEQYQSNIS